MELPKIQPPVSLRVTFLAWVLWTSLLPLPAQCPPLDFGATRWELPNEKDTLRASLLEALRSGFDKYCETAHLLDSDRAQFSEATARDFLSLFNAGAMVYNDVQTSRLEHLSIERYRDFIYEHFFHTGVDFRISEARIVQVERLENLYLATIQFRKTMHGHLDTKGRFRDDPTGKTAHHLDMEVHLIPVRENEFRFKIYGIRKPLPVGDVARSQSYTDVRVGGWAGALSTSTPVYPWAEGDLGAFRDQHFATGVEVARWRSLPRSARWFFGLGLGLRVGSWAHDLERDLSLSISGSDDHVMIDGRRFNTPFHESLFFREGTQVTYTYQSVYLPLGVRAILRSNSRSEWLLDAEVLGGLSRVTERVDGNLELIRSYTQSGEPYCISSPLALGEGKGITAAWFQPFLSLRLSPAYYRTIAAWSHSKRDVGWFFRLDTEYNLLPLIDRLGSDPWWERDIRHETGEFSADNASSNILVSRAGGFLLGIRSGLYWKL